MTPTTFSTTPSKRSIYVIGGAGAVDVLRQRDPNNYERVARITTAAGARTGLFVASSNRLYIAVPHRGSQAAKVLQCGIANYLLSEPDADAIDDGE
jgi:hypothetical protein